MKRLFILLVSLFVIFYPLYATESIETDDDIKNNEVEKISSEDFLRASARLDVDTVRKYLESGGDPNYFHPVSKMTALIILSFNRPAGQKNPIPDPYESIEIMKILLNYGADINFKTEDDGTTALMVAALSFRVELVEFLLKSGANPNLQDDEGYTALHYAARNFDFMYEHKFHEMVLRKTDIAKILIEHGADYNIKNNEDLNPLMYARNIGHVKLYHFFKSIGAEETTDLDFSSSEAKGLFFNAVVWRDIELVEFYLRNGVDVNSILEFDKRNALMRLVSYYTLESFPTVDLIPVARLLIEKYNIDLTYENEDKDGISVIEMLIHADNLSTMSKKKKKMRQDLKKYLDQELEKMQINYNEDALF